MVTAAGEEMQVRVGGAGRGATSQFAQPEGLETTMTSEGPGLKTPNGIFFGGFSNVAKKCYLTHL